MLVKYFSMSKTLVLLIVLVALVGLLIYQQGSFNNNPEVLSVDVKLSYWFMLHRKSNKEFLYLGQPGKIQESQLVKTFIVKTGVPNQKPTPLPKLLGREYWLIVDEMESLENPETAPYFLTLDIPVTEEEPFGPTRYGECNGQCNWEIPGAFGLHGVNGDLSRLSKGNPGSSGCIRHSDEDITYLYNLLDPWSMEIRYYVEEI